MSAIRAKRNFDNETTVHTQHGHLVNKQPIRTNNALKRNLDIRDSQSVRSVYNKFFK